MTHMTLTSGSPGHFPVRVPSPTVGHDSTRIRPNSHAFVDHLLNILRVHSIKKRDPGLLGRGEHTSTGVNKHLWHLVNEQK